MRYTVVLEQEEDGGYVASVRRCRDASARATPATKRGAISVKPLSVEDCRDAGDPIPTEAGKEFVEIVAA